MFKGHVSHLIITCSNILGLYGSSGIQFVYRWLFIAFYWLWDVGKKMRTIYHAQRESATEFSEQLPPGGERQPGVTIWVEISHWDKAMKAQSVNAPARSPIWVGMPSMHDLSAITCPPVVQESSVFIEDRSALPGRVKKGCFRSTADSTLLLLRAP